MSSLRHVQSNLQPTVKADWRTEISKALKHPSGAGNAETSQDDHNTEAFHNGEGAFEEAGGYLAMDEAASAALYSCLGGCL